MRRLIVFVTLISLVMIALSGPAGALLVRAAPFAQSLAVITSPQSMTTIAGNVVIEGSASHPAFWKYEVHYGLEPNPSEWIIIGSVHESPVVSGRLEIWNTALVPDGTYSLRLRVARKDGNYDEYYVRQLTVSNSRPTETPTPAETATPTITPTPLPPTPTIVIEQPRRDTPTPSLSPTAGPTPVPTPTVAAESKLDLSGLTDSFCKGTLIVLGVFAALGGLALFRKVLVSMVQWVIRKIKKEEEPDDAMWRR